jgi:hypothetical protein
MPAGVGVVLVEKAAQNVVVAIAEDGGGDGDAVAEEAANRGASAVELWLDVFEDDSLSAFGRFHLVPIVRVDCIFMESLPLQEIEHFFYRQLAASYRSAG